MPQMGVSVAEGTIVEWRKRPGDWVEADETVCDVTTDKIDVEIPSPGHRPPGADPGRAGRDRRRSARRSPRSTPAARARRGRIRRSTTAPAAETSRAQAEAAAASRPPRADGEPDRSRFYSPVVRRIAEEHGVDLDAGRGAPGSAGGSARRTCWPHRARRRRRQERARCTPSRRYQQAEAAPQRAAPDGGAPRGRRASAEELGRGRREPMSPMRQAIAEHMVAQPAHRGALHDDRRGRLLAASPRGARSSSEAMARRGVPLTYLAFVARATVEALERASVLNASIEGDEIVHHDDVNLGIAVALDDGLIVPVIRRPSGSASRASPPRSPTSPSARARARLEPDDVHGGTFTITNPGQFGAVLATPIINQPQVAILDLEAIVKRPVVVDDGRRRRDRDPADVATSACRGTTGRSTAPTRPGSWPTSRSRSRGGRPDERRNGEAPRADGDRRPAERLDHEELVVRRGRRSGLYAIVAVHSTAPARARRRADVALRRRRRDARRRRAAAGARR